MKKLFCFCWLPFLLVSIEGLKKYKGMTLIKICRNMLQGCDVGLQKGTKIWGDS